jgi:toxin YhaV
LAAKARKSRKKKPLPKRSQTALSAVTVNGWTILAHPLFIAQIDKLVRVVESEDERGIPHGASRNLLGHLLDLAFEKIPQDPSSTQYRQGKTLGSDYKHWARAKTGNGRYRLFFRYSKSARVILYVWVNDQDTLRTYGSRDDAYSVFARMLDSGNPPDDWESLVKASEEPSLRKALSALAERVRGRKRQR